MRSEFCVVLGGTMISKGREDISKWASRIDTVISRTDSCCVRRVVVVESTPSTMDAAVAIGECGLLVVASEQTNGRGQRGRVWQDVSRRTLPCTFVVNATGIDSAMLSAIVGCAVHETIQSLVPSSSTVMIKWPNDIVVREPAGTYERDRKIAGVLIEQRGGCAHIGIGINCAQGEADWGSDIKESAISLSQIGAQIARLDLVCTLVEHLSHWLVAQDRAAIRSYYQAHDAMIHTRRSFQYDNRRFDGVVECLDPLECIAVQTQTGTHRLPIAQTQHLRADA